MNYPWRKRVSISVELKTLESVSLTTSEHEDAAVVNIRLKDQTYHQMKAAKVYGATKASK
jgi:hypothetical protein